MKWGVRRYQNPDGTLTSAGKKRYSEGDLDEIKKASEKGAKVFGVAGGIINGLRKKREIDKRNAEAEKNKKDDDDEKKKAEANDNSRSVTNAKDGKASSIYTEKELNDIGKDHELDYLMFLELNEHNRSKLIGKEDSDEYNAEFEKFRKDPHNYKLPDSQRKQFDNDFTEAEKDKIRQETKVKSDPQRQEAKKNALNNAKTKGLYDLNFLEAVQNEDWYDNDKKMLSEYSKYLDDPRKYWTER